MCANANETVEHLFCGCAVARQLWGVNDVLQGESLCAFMDTTLCLPNDDRAIHMAAVFWVLWSARNDKVWKDGNWTLEGLRMQVQSLLLCYNTAYGSHAPVVANVIPMSLFPPPHGTLKCNLDAAIFDDGAGYGAIIWDHQGLFVAAKSARLGCDRDPLLAEALAVKETSIIVESNCLNFCYALKSIIKP